MHAPAFWYYNRLSVLSVLLWPAGWLYGVGTRLRSRLVRPQKADKPVICIGNFVAGGAGKTPTALALATLLSEKNISVAFLTRGYGGELPGPLHVDRNHHTALQVGDEALLLAAAGPTVVSKNRPAGAKALSRSCADVIIMDDGFQNPSLHKDLSIIVIDHKQGVGNGHIIPSGPLRGPLLDQIANSDIIVVSGGSLVDHRLDQRMKKSGKPVFSAQLVAADNAPQLEGKKVIAFTGIGVPEKFFTTVEQAGADVIEKIRFPDHHRFSESEANWLLSLQADNKNCLLLTTAKDHIRLKGQSGACDRLFHSSLYFGVDLKFDQEEAFLQAILPALKANA